MSIKRTPLYDRHIQAGARMTEYAGWQMPIMYTSLTDEHHAVRNKAGLFDVSHMGEIFVQGPQAEEYINLIFSNDVADIEDGAIIYGFLLYPDGGVVDDLLVYKVSDDYFIFVVNAANTDKDFEWMMKYAGDYDVIVDNNSDEIGQIAIQGPMAEKILQALVPIDLTDIMPFHFVDDIPLANTRALISRTGYTGEDGFEIYLPPAQAHDLWQKLLEAGAVPAGLGARDTLRLEAALPLYGHELSPDISPLDAGLERFVFSAKPQPGFVGQEALATAGQSRKLIGLKALGRTIPRQGYPLIQSGKPIGTVTSGGYSPTLERGIALASVEATTVIDGSVLVRIRDKDEPFEVCSLPFVKRG